MFRLVSACSLGGLCVCMWLGCSASESTDSVSSPVSPAPTKTSPTSPTSVREQVIAGFWDVPEGLPPLSDPTHKSAHEAEHMRPTDVVFGVVLEGQARAYPWWITKNYHVINDMLADVPILVSFCEQCSGAAVFRRNVKDRVLEWYLLGMNKGTLVICDRQTETLWSPFDGEAIEGQLEGQQLQRIPMFYTRWDDWKTRFPETTVVWDQEFRRRGHGSWYTPGKWGIIAEVGRTLDHWDDRLSENDLVFGVDLAEADKAYHLQSVKDAGRVVNDEIADTPAVVFARGEFEMAAYDRRLASQTLEFEPTSDSRAIARDRDTGSFWTVDGRCVDGPHKGDSLNPLDGYLAEWHIWSGFHPLTEVYFQARDPQAFSFPDLKLTRVNRELPHPDRSPAEVRVIATWALWCPPCREELPFLAQLAAKYSDKQLQIAAIAMNMPGDEIDHIVSYLQEQQLPIPVLLNSERFHDRLEALCQENRGHGVTLPMFFVLDKQRTVRKVLRGDEMDQLGSAIEQVLSER